MRRHLLKALCLASSMTVAAACGGGGAGAPPPPPTTNPLPAAFESLAAGFAAEVVLEPGLPDPTKIAKIALAPPADGRIFYLEVDTGNVRVVDPVQGLLAAPFATLNVLQGAHLGLLGLALAPDFATSGHVYVLATVPAAGAQADRSAVYRYTDVGSVGTNRVTVVDDLPVSSDLAMGGGINNGGEILFDLSGRLLVSLGDVRVPANAQADAGTSLAGKVLRYDVGTLPATAAADNPFPGSPEWCRGLRNTFGLAVHFQTGGLFGVDNGVNSDDELNFLQAGKNFEWGGNPTGPVVGFKMRNYATEIVPTALCWHDGTAWGAAYANNLFLASYGEQTLRRFVLSGSAFADIDAEEVFATFKLDGDKHHPLDVERATDGSLFVSTFSGIYRIYRP
jgi:glucose/arabinose dehydrogenase